MGEEELTVEGPSEEVIAEGGRLLEEAVAELPAEDIDRLLRGLPPTISMEVVKDLLGNKLDPRRLKHLGPLMVGPLKKRPVTRLLPTIERLSTGILGTFHTHLGEQRFENPSADDLREVLEAVFSDQPVAGVRCTLAWVVAEGMPAAEAARAVLLTDPRLRLPGWPEEPGPAAPPPA